MVDPIDDTVSQKRNLAPIGQEDKQDEALSYDDTAFYYFASSVIVVFLVPWTYSAPIYIYICIHMCIYIYIYMYTYVYT